jgi:DNA-binding CsgD family transcriptional regulator
MIAQRKPNSPYVKSVRAMTKADIESLREPSARERIKNLRDSHHIMARLIVSGLSLAEIAEETGYSITRVSVLRNSPAMKELCDRYRGDDHETWKARRDERYEAILAAGTKAWRQIVDALDEPEPLPVTTLLKIADSSSDRVGYHRKTTKENINVNFAARLEEAIKRSRPLLIDGGDE